MKARFPFTKNVLTSAVKNVLLELEVKVAAPGTNEAFQNNLYRSGMTARIISNEEMKDIMEIVKSVEKSCLLIKSVSKTLENKVKNKGWFLNVLLDKLAASWKYLNKQRS